MRERAISIHSSRGGTGKTLIAANLAAIYAIKGLNVALLDLDFRAPSLVDVFSKGIRDPVTYWLNDFMDGRCKAKQVLTNVSQAYGLKGKLLLGFADPSIEAIRNIMEKSRAWEVTAVKRLFSLRSALFDDMGIDCCILDTSPGVQYASINAVVSSDISVVVATPDSLELKGLQNMLAELYDAFARRTVILINKVFPETRTWSIEQQKNLISQMEKSLGHSVIGVIPCYCDVLQAKKTSLLAVDKPYHPFLRNLEEVAEKLESINITNMEEDVVCKAKP
jgi:MinD-like ATPase involved in chromosome partitioning or flagellar assembly